MTYIGGKNGAGVYQQIINQIPPHKIFIEAFAGSAAITRQKRPAQQTVLIEANGIQAEHLSACNLPGSIVIYGDALEELALYRWSGGEFVYLDPPYLFSVRDSAGALYRHEFGTDAEHRRLLALAKRLPCMVAISGYWSELYAEELAGWRAISFQTVKRSGAVATEWLWMNYAAPMALHDYRYLGGNFRERERIKRKKERWTKRLESLPELERLALLAAIDELSSSIAGSGDTHRR